MILLNGASSSGKSSIGRALLPMLAEPWFLVPVDAVGAMRSTVHTRVLDDAESTEMLQRTRLGYHRLVAALASVGNDVIMDYPLSESWRLEDLLDVLEGYDVTLVEVRCEPSELARRERSRGDRPIGLARSQTGVYGHGDYDLAIAHHAHQPGGVCPNDCRPLGHARPFVQSVRAAQEPYSDADVSREVLTGEGGACGEYSC